MGEPDERDHGLARERTRLAWGRTALSFAAVGGIVAKSELLPGLVILAMAAAVWQLGRMTWPNRPRLITTAIVAVTLIALIVALLTATGVRHSLAG